MLEIVIIEDEPAIARNLHAMLVEAGETVNVLAVLDGVRSSIEWFAAGDKRYDLVFMDIRLSDGLSFDIPEQVAINSPIIFVTAYDDYALPAFKTNGIAYILKPFDKADLELAMQKFRLLNKAVATEGGSFATLVHLLKKEYKGYRQSFLFHFRDKLVPVAAKDIGWFYSLNEVTHACSIDNRKFTADLTLEQLQQQLDPQHFFRANRQFIIQRKIITEVEFFFNGRLLLKTTPATPENILISKARVPEFKAWMNS